MNRALSNPQFWRLYYHLESDSLSEADIAVQLRDLSEHFILRTDTDGDDDEPRYTVEFRLPCGDAFELFIEYEPDPFGSAITLFIRSVAEDAREQMGWWDLARWHPYCIHPDELDALLEYWARQNTAWPDQRVALLLLAPFVGLADETMRQALSARVDAAYRELCPEGGNADLRLHVNEEDQHRWERDDELGWLFSADYACYSLRNRAHRGGEEGVFPFARFYTLMSEIRAAL